MRVSISYSNISKVLMLSNEFDLAGWISGFYSGNKVKGLLTVAVMFSNK